MYYKAITSVPHTAIISGWISENGNSLVNKNKLLIAILSRIIESAYHFKWIPEIKALDVIDEINNVRTSTPISYYRFLLTIM